MWAKFRKMALAVIAAATVSPASAQFVLTPDGFVNSVDGSGSYVIECPGVSCERLYRALRYCAESYLSGPFTYFSEMEPEAFTVNAKMPKGLLVGYKSLFGGKVYDISFRIRFDVRDGAVSMFVPEVKSMQFGIFKTKYSDVDLDVEADFGFDSKSVSVEMPQQVVSVERLYVSAQYCPVGGNPYPNNAYSSVIFNRKGTVSNSAAKEALEYYFNTLAGTFRECLLHEVAKSNISVIDNILENGTSEE